MLKIAADTVMAAYANVTLFAQQLRGILDDNEDETMHVAAASFHLLVVSIEQVSKSAAELEMSAAVAAANRCQWIIDRLSPGQGTYAGSRQDLLSLSNYCSQLSQSFIDELGGRPVYILPLGSMRELESSAPLFGVAVEEAFPMVGAEVREAAYCLVFGRNTSAVFHLMRAMESAVQTLAQCVGVSKIDKEWGKLLSDIGRAIEAMPKDSGRNQWSESHSHLYHVKQAWRNDTMHPNKSYEGAEAKAVFDAVRSFLLHLSPLVAARQ